jgi:hypothetical protein
MTIVCPPTCTRGSLCQSISMGIEGLAHCPDLFGMPGLSNRKTRPLIRPGDCSPLAKRGWLSVESDSRGAGRPAVAFLLPPECLPRAPRFLAVTAVVPMTSRDASAQARDRHQQDEGFPIARGHQRLRRHASRTGPHPVESEQHDGAGADVPPRPSPCVPPPVVQAARILHEDHVKRHVECDDDCKYFSVLGRLLTDDRMEVVWKELRKLHRENYRSTKVFKYPSRLFLSTHDAVERQNNAMTSLFHFAFNLALCPPRMATAAEVHTWRSKYIHDAATLKTAAELLRHQAALYGPRGGASQTAAAQVNDDAARAYEAKAALWAAADRSSRLVVRLDVSAALRRRVVLRSSWSRGSVNSSGSAHWD